MTQIGDGQIQAPANAGCTAVQTVTSHAASGVSSTPVAAVATSSAAQSPSSTSARPSAYTGAASLNKPAVAVVAGLMGLAALF